MEATSWGPTWPLGVKMLLQPAGPLGCERDPVIGMQSQHAQKNLGTQSRAPAFAWFSSNAHTDLCQERSQDAGVAKGPRVRAYASVRELKPSARASPLAFPLVVVGGRLTCGCCRGAQVKIMKTWDPTGREGPKTPLPDVVVVHTPKVRPTF